MLHDRIEHTFEYRMVLFELLVLLLTSSSLYYYDLILPIKKLAPFLGQRHNRRTSLPTQLPAPNLEELSTGVHFCVLLHILTKEKFMVNKVNYKAKLEH